MWGKVRRRRLHQARLLAAAALAALRAHHRHTPALHGRQAVGQHVAMALLRLLRHGRQAASQGSVGGGGSGEGDAWQLGAGTALRGARRPGRLAPARERHPWRWVGRAGRSPAPHPGLPAAGAAPRTFSVAGALRYCPIQAWGAAQPPRHEFASACGPVCAMRLPGAPKSECGLLERCSLCCRHGLPQTAGGNTVPGAGGLPAPMRPPGLLRSWRHVVGTDRTARREGRNAKAGQRALAAAAHGSTPRPGKFLLQSLGLRLSMHGGARQR